MTMIPYPRFLTLARANLCLLAEIRDRGFRVLSMHYEQRGGPVDFMLADDREEYYLARVVPEHTGDDWSVQWVRELPSALRKSEAQGMTMPLHADALLEMVNR